MQIDCGPLTNQQLECIMATMNLTAASVRQLVSYDPETGIFTSLVGGGRFHRGRQTGSANKCGYVRVYVAGRYYKAHRLAWFYMTGEWPAAIDHINGDGCDNRWANLRNVSVAVNNENLRGARADSIIGLLGVSRSRSGKFTATIGTTLDGTHVQLSLGTYETAEKAHAVYLDAKRRLHAGCTI